MTLADVANVALTVIASVGGGGFIILKFSGYLGKRWADRALEKQRQEYAELNARLSSSLRLAELEHQIRFSKLQERRAGVIEDIYHRGLQIERKGYRFISSGRRSKNENYENEFLELDKEYVEFYLFVEDNSIYFPEKACTLLNELVAVLRKHVINVETYADIGPNPTPKEIKERREAVTAAFDAFHNEIPKVKKAIALEFRKMLGVESSEP